MQTIDSLWPIFEAIQAETPLVQAITNYVTINDCANILLAGGASPAMCEASEEAYDFSFLSQALYINIGTLTKEQEEAMVRAAIGAKEKGIPVIVDPVGCAAIPRRVPFLEKLRDQGRIDVLKGNLSEIKALAGLQSQARGVDALDSDEDATELCQNLAKTWNCIVAITGRRDYISDGTQTVYIDNGTEMLTKITGAGCMLGALTAGYCGAQATQLFEATILAHLTMAIAGEHAAQDEKGYLPGAFRSHLMDYVYITKSKMLKDKAKIHWAHALT